MNLREILAELVAFPSVSGNYEQAVALLSYARAHTNGDLYERDFVSNDFPSLILTTQKTQAPKVTLQAHIDVVPGLDGQFRLVADGDKLYGRGVFDMKFALACYLRLVDELRPNLADYDFAIMLTSDEEVAGNDGSRALLDSGYRTDVCVLPDGGDNWGIEQRIKGMWVFTLRAEGVSAHGLRPWTADNASQKLIRALYDIQQLNTDEPMGTTVAVTKLLAKTAHTKIPDAAQAVVDTRFMTLADYEALHGAVTAIAKKYDCTVESFAFNGPILHDLAHPLVKPFLDSAEHVMGKRLQPGLSYGSSDGRFFVDHHIPVVAMRPDGGDQHGPDEWISESSLEQFYQTLKHYVQSVALIR
jgi:acetylornithine deacetylase/succinyl-diaminopimelate desuccinylase-like protein